MFISCAKCSTAYVLDDALIPPQGAPVQCTKCNHVFFVKLPPPGEAGAKASGVRPPSKPVVTHSEQKVKQNALQERASVPMVKGSDIAASKQGSSSKSVGQSSKTAYFGGAAAPATSPPGAVSEKGAIFPDLVSTGKVESPVPSDGKTRVFGKPIVKSPSSAIKKPGSGVVSPNDGKTRVFGKPALKSPSAVVVPKVSGSSSVTSSNDGKTRVFGTPQRIASEPGTPASQIAPPVAAQPPAPAPEDGNTRVFGTPKPQLPPAAPNDGNTRVFGTPVPNYPPAVPPPHAASAQGSHSETRVFGTPIPAPPPKTELPVAQAEPEPPAAEADVSVDLSKTAEMEFELPKAKELPSAEKPKAEEPPEHSRPQLPFAIPEKDDRQTGDGEPKVSVEATLELPPEESVPKPRSSRPLPEEFLAEAEQAVETGRSARVALRVFFALSAVLALGLGAYIVQHYRGTKNVSETRNIIVMANSALRRDDPPSRRAALALVKPLRGTGAGPAAVSLLAAALDSDDAKAYLARSSGLLRDLAARQNMKTNPSAQLLQDIKVLTEAETQAVAEANESTRALDDAQAVLEAAMAQPMSPEEAYESARAIAYAAAVRGDGKVLELNEKLKQMKHGWDPWAELILPEFALNGGSDRTGALKQLEEIVKRDPTFLRPYLLLARLWLLERNVDRAEAELVRIAAMNANHQELQRLEASLAIRGRY